MLPVCDIYFVQLLISSNSVVAESALDRLCCALGGKTMLSLIMASIPAMLSSTDWRQRHAALMAVSSAGEGCHKQMEMMLDEIMTGVLGFLNDQVTILSSHSTSCCAYMNTGHSFSM